MTDAARPTWLARLTGRGGSTRVGGVRQVPEADPVWPVDATRIEEYLSSKDFRFIRDADGDVTGNWDDNRFWFMLLGNRREIVQVRGRWRQPIPQSHRSVALHAANDWNRERIWPKVYVRTEEDSLALYAEVSTDFSAGASDAQLAQVLSCGLATALQFFSVADAELAGSAPIEPPEPGFDD